MPVEPKVQIRALGASEALKVLQGLERRLTEAGKAARQAAQEQDKAARAAAEAQKKAAREAERAAAQQAAAAQKAANAKAKASQQAAAAAERAQAEIERTAKREAERWRQLAVESARVRARAEEEATRKAATEAAKRVAQAERSAASEVKARQDAWRKAGGMLMAGTAAVVAGATVAAGTARSVAGVKDVRERITSANEFRERLIIATDQAGMSPEERERTQAQVLGASRATGKDIGELMSVLETGQAQFNNLRFFADHLTEIATIAKASGADTGEFAKALGFVQQAFGLTGDQAMEAAYLMKASADLGSVELKDFARDFSAAAGSFKLNTGMTGMAGVRQFLGAAQGVATGGFGSANSETRMTQAVAYLNRKEVRQKLKGIGIKNLGPNGTIDVASVIEQLSTNKKFGSATKRQEIFHDLQAREGIEALIEARRRVREGKTGAVDLNTIAAVNPEAGRAAVGRTMQAFQSEGFFQMQQEVARMQAETVENLRGYNDQVLAVAEASDKLESAFGRLSLWANSIAAAGVVGGAASLVGKVAGGGAGAAAAGAGGSALAKALPSVANAGTAIAGAGTAALAAGGTAVGAASAGMLGAFGSAGLLAGLAAGTLINEGSGWVSRDDKRISDRLAESLFEAFNSADARFQKGARIENLNDDGTKRLITVMQDSNRKLETIANNLRAQETKPQPARREPR